MDRETAGRLLAENLHKIYAWAMARTFDKTEAEDLAGDIVCAVLRSAEGLEKDEAFFGFMWGTAKNLFRARLRQKKRETAKPDGENGGVCWRTPEDEFISSEQIMLLRREFSLLSGQYREVTVLHYIYNKSCREISERLNISAEMVKYYLFKTRKILKEGIGMVRELGEKSYDPHKFTINYWGESSRGYNELFERKLPGNLLLAAYEKAMTLGELALELGVAAAYLEDETEILERYELLKQSGGKYRTNIIIFTEEYDKKAFGSFAPVCKKAAKEFWRGLTEALPKLKKLDFYGRDYDGERFKWTFANIALYHAMCKSDDEFRKKSGDYPLLANGFRGFVFGHDGQETERHLNGIYGCCVSSGNPAWISVENYRVIGKCQNWYPHDWEKTMLAMTDAVLFKAADENNEQLIRLIDEGVIASDNGMLKPQFPVFGEEVFFGAVKELLESAVWAAYECMEEVCGIAAETLKRFVPDALAGECGRIAFVRHRAEVMALIVEALIEEKYLTVPEEKTCLCMFGVDTRKK